MEYNTFHMQVLFVRHGESDTNAGDVFHHDPSLTEKGRRQSIEVGKRLANQHVEAIYTSPLTRAVETANVIAIHHQCPIIESPALVERVRPSSMFGMAKKSPQYAQIHHAYLDAFAAGKAYEDAESYQQIMQRVLDAQASVIVPVDGTIVVVSHGNFIRACIGQVLFGEHLTPRLLSDIRSHFRTINTGITEFEVVDGKWKLVSANDYSHLSADLASFTA